MNGYMHSMVLFQDRDENYDFWNNRYPLLSEQMDRHEISLAAQKKYKK